MRLNALLCTSVRLFAFQCTLNALHCPNFKVSRSNYELSSVLTFLRCRIIKSILKISIEPKNYFNLTKFNFSAFFVINSPKKNFFFLIKFQFLTAFLSFYQGGGADGVRGNHSNDNPFYSNIDSMPDIRPRRKSIPLVSELVSSEKRFFFSNIL